MSPIEHFKSLLQKEIVVDTIDKHFAEIADCLMNHLCLKVGEKSYRIIEIEFYYLDEKEHHDTFSHKNEEQLKNGTWYFNGFGLDITFGNNELKRYGGILIRGIRTIEENPKYFSGPSVLLKELFKNLGSIFESSNSFVLESYNHSQIKAEKIINSPRINLPKSKANNDFFEKKYRYITELNVVHKFPEKYKVFNELVARNDLKIEEDAIKVLGYNLKSK